MSDQPPSSGDPKPTVFKERYELHRKLARGGMSDVFLARDLLLDRPVAVKVLFPEYAKDPTFVERFRREAQAAARLNQGNIVAIYDWGEELGTYFIAMEYVDGRSLSEVIRAEGPLTPARAAEITADVAAALSFAHRNGVVHRDIKPGNVLISPQGQVKVADFGIAQALTGGDQVNLTQTGAVMGTATYFSPEQAQGKTVDQRSDLYSLGCVLYEMLVTRPPFTGDTPVAIAYKHVQEQPTAPSALGVNVPAPLEAITMKLLAKEPANRYPDGDALRADLRRFHDGQAVEAAVAPVAATTAIPVTPAAPVAVVGDAAYRPPQPTDVVPDEPHRSGWLVAIMVALLALLGVALFLVGANLSGESTRQLEVPNVVNLPVGEATAELQSRGFTVTTVEEPNAEVARGIVFDQDPDGGTRADEGSDVRLTVSAGVEQATVPNVIGFSEVQARSLIESAGFLFRLQTATDPNVPEGEVISQNPAPQAMADKGSEITVVVSAGAERVDIPNVLGQTQTTATNRLRDEGFEVVVRTASNASVPEGNVISTDPAPGESARPGSSVTIVVSTGPEPTTTTTTTAPPTTTTTAAPTTTTTAPTTTTTTEAP